MVQLGRESEVSTVLMTQQSKMRGWIETDLIDSL